MSKLMIIDDDKQICSFLSKLSEQMGFESRTALTMNEGLKVSRENPFDLILLDLDLPDGNGLQILPTLIKLPSSPEVIIITGSTHVAGAEIAFKYGAWDYVRKPFNYHDVSLPITRALQYRKEKEHVPPAPFPLKRSGIIGNSPEIERCLECVAKAAVIDASVLITGETGTGKELFARAIHENSPRSAKVFIPVDCGALPENLIENMLFGHEKGAFTGADVRREGLLVQADGGTLFLDEIGELPLNTQRTLLRTLQEKKIRPLGSKQEIPIDFRLVAATNRDLGTMIHEGLFREDLLYRIRAIEIKLPALRERKEDLHEIVTTRVHQLGARYKMGMKGISPEFFDTLSSNPWPGNVRELINVLEYALACAGSDPTLVPKHLPPDYRTARFKESMPLPAEIPPGELSSQDIPTLSDYREKADKQYLQMLLARARSDRDKACRLSGLSQSRLYSLLKKFDFPGFRA